MLKISSAVDLKWGKNKKKTCFHGQLLVGLIPSQKESQSWLVILSIKVLIQSININSVIYFNHDYWWQWWRFLINDKLWLVQYHKTNIRGESSLIK